MTREQHIEVHKGLHRNLDLLIADFIRHHSNYKSMLETTLKELMEWSYKQTMDPDE